MNVRQVGHVLDNPNVLRNTLINAALPLVPPPAPLPPPPVNVTDCVNTTLIDGGCPLLTTPSPPYPDASSGGVATAAGALPANPIGGVSSPLLPLQQAPQYGGAQAPPAAPTDQYSARGGLGANVQATLPPAVPWVQQTLPPVAPPFQPAEAVPGAPSAAGAPPADQAAAPWWSMPNEFAPGACWPLLCRQPIRF